MSTRFSSVTYLGVCSVTTLLLNWPLPAQAACTLVITAGDDTTLCRDGSAGTLTDLQGSNVLEFPVGGTGIIVGNVTYGAGDDRVTMDSGAINGAINQGDGRNIFQLFNGNISGTVTQGSGRDIAQISGGSSGAISQGDGVDQYFQSGGNVTSLAQGDGHDEFTMSSGKIIGAFEDGDIALMTGGSIGRVDMKLDNNLFDLRGGEIFGNLVTGFGNDTILVSGGTVGGNISVSGGNDIIKVSGGEIDGQILASFGDDEFSWEGGGLIHKEILMGEGADKGFLHNLTETTLASTPRLDGGLGNDTLTFDNTQSATPTRYINWETVNLDNNSRLTLGGDFKLGDSATATGTMNIFGSAALQVTQGSISPFTAGQQANLNNGGLIDMTTGSSSATDSLTVNGNYTGNGGELALQSVLGADGSASDKLVVSQGTLQGGTTVTVTNLAGPGAMTRQNGIQVVEALNGATSSDLAFTLRGGAVSAGAYEYYLFKGGVTPGTGQNWFLRSAVVAPPLPNPGDPEDPDDPVGILPPVPADGTPDLPGIFPGEEPIPIYRPEVPVYAVLFPAVQQMVQGMLGTYHERMGDQSLQRQPGALAAGWGRVYGSSTRQSFAGTVSPSLDSSISGFQVGTDLYAWTDDAGLTQRFGFFVGHSRLTGNVAGFNSGFQGKDAGNTTLRGDSLGAYWTLIGANRAYIDFVLMGTRFDGHSESDRGLKLPTKGHNVLGSVEVGMPFAVSEHWEVEPQAQVIVDRSYLDSQNDGISDVSFSADTNIVTRLGIRLKGSYSVSGMPLLPYVRTNVWHASAGNNTVTFNDSTDINTEQKSTTLDISTGTTLQVSSTVSVYGEVGYNSNLDSNQLNGRKGTIGIRIEF